MGIGATIRRSLGRWEIPAAEFYRNRFINLDDLAATLASLTTPKRILEIGCGEGAFAQRLCEVYPDAEYVGIDIAAEPGRLFRGDTERVTFRTITSTEFLAEQPQPFDLVCVIDVVHHLPEELRVPVLTEAATLTTADGVIAVKEWERGRGLSHAIAFTADRYVTGDKTVRFAEHDELLGYLEGGLPDFEILCESRVPPRRNNVLWVLARAGQRSR